MKSSLFPDVNVWLALTHNRHIHHTLAAEWFESAGGCSFLLCRFTQLGLLRLLTNVQVMGEDTMSQRAAWAVYHRWLEDGRIDFVREPDTGGFDPAFQAASSKQQPATKLWADAYLAAFAKTAGLTLVTFDRHFPRLAGLEIELLKPGL
jgi:uncharacterized protein